MLAVIVLVVVTFFHVILIQEDYLYAAICSDSLEDASTDTEDDFGC